RFGPRCSKTATCSADLTNSGAQRVLGAEVALDFYFFARAFIEDSLVNAGFELEARIERRPCATEHPTTRAYVLARRPIGSPRSGSGTRAARVHLAARSPVIIVRLV